LETRLILLQKPWLISSKTVLMDNTGGGSILFEQRDDFFHSSQTPRAIIFECCLLNSNINSTILKGKL